MFFTFWPDLGSTPARVNRFTGEIQINNRYFRNMPDFRKKFIIQHEKGHYNLDTRSEFEADDYAFRMLAGSEPNSLKESVKSISQVLSFRNPEHLDRLFEVVKKALAFDFERNGNQRAKQALDQLNELNKNHKLTNFHMNSISDNDYFEPKFGGDTDTDDMYDNAKGKAKRQAKKAARAAKRQEKKQTRIKNRQTKVEARTNRKATRQNARVGRKQTRVEARVARKITRKSFESPQTPLTEPTLNDPIQTDDVLMEQSYPVDETSASYPQQVYPDEQYPDDEGNYEEETTEEETEEEAEEEPSEFVDEDGNVDPSYYDNAGGKAARQARRAERKKAKEEKRKLKNEKKAAKVDVIKARADAKRTRAESKLTLAKQGKSGSDWLGSAVDSIAGIFGGGKKNSDAEMPLDDSGEMPEEPKKILGMPKPVAIGVIAVVVILIIVGIVFFLKRKK